MQQTQLALKQKTIESWTNRPYLSLLDLCGEAVAAGAAGRYRASALPVWEQSQLHPAGTYTFSDGGLHVVTLYFNNKTVCESISEDLNNGVTGEKVLEAFLFILQTD